jgi:vesicle coat complex subunit
VASPIIPVRASGLVQLRRMVLLRQIDSSRLQTALQNFSASLSHDDSYVYLAAIQGISAIGDIEIDIVLPFLSRKYTDEKLKPEVRLNLGEAIMQISRRLGELLPKYSQQIFNLLAAALKDSDAMVRASALSNISEMCSMMKQGLRPFIEEICIMINNVITTYDDF